MASSRRAVSFSTASFFDPLTGGYVLCTLDRHEVKRQKNPIFAIVGKVILCPQERSPAREIPAKAEA